MANREVYSTRNYYECDCGRNSLQVNVYCPCFSGSCEAVKKGKIETVIVWRDTNIN